MSGVDKAWFMDKLAERRMSVRSLAKLIGMDSSAVSRTFSGERRMQIEDAHQFAQALLVPVDEVMERAGLAPDAAASPTRRIQFTAIIHYNGLFEYVPEHATLPEHVMRKAQAALRSGGSPNIHAALVRDDKGPMSMWDDTVILYREPRGIDMLSIGSLAVCLEKGRDDQRLLRLQSVRKSGEAVAVTPAGDIVNVVLSNATPVIAVIP